MDVGSILVTPVPYGIGDVARVPRPGTSGVPADRIQTDLEPVAAVEAVSRVGHSGGVDPDTEQRPVAVERRLTIDPATRAYVSEVLDERSGEVLSQVPDQGLLRLKAYAQAVVAAIDLRTARARLLRSA